MADEETFKLTVEIGDPSRRILIRSVSCDGPITIAGRAAKRHKDGYYFLDISDMGLEFGPKDDITLPIADD